MAWHDTQAHSCDWYATQPNACAQLHHDNTSAAAICCSCGGGRNMTWTPYPSEGIFLNHPSGYRLSSRSSHAEMLNSAADTVSIRLEWPTTPAVAAVAVTNGELVNLQFWEDQMSSMGSTIAVTGSTIGNGTNVSYSIAQAPQEWTDVVVLNDLAQEVLKDNKTLFNQLFAECPVVQYMRNNEVVAVYVRTSAVPDSLDAHRLFTYTWSNEHNMLGQDFELYDSLDLALTESNTDRWSYCDYNDQDIGFPRNCGRDGMVPDRWFSMPAEPAYEQFRFPPRGVLQGGLRLQILSGGSDSCPVHPSVVATKSTATVAFTYVKCIGNNCCSLHLCSDVYDLRIVTRITNTTQCAPLTFGLLQHGRCPPLWTLRIVCSSWLADINSQRATEHSINHSQ
jgi:hypothetical protein